MVKAIEERVVGADGVQIYRSCWLPEGTIRAQLTLLHGYAEHCSRYAAWIDALLAEGIAVFALDHKGHGRSEGRTAYITNFRSLLPDALSTMRWAAERVPGVPRLLYGHSMGGALAALIAIEHPESVDLLVMSAPAVKVSEDISPLMQKMAGFISAIAPTLPAARLDPNLISRDADVVAAYKADPLVYTGGVLARSGHSLLSTEALILGRAAELTTPFLIMHGSADGLADPRGSEGLQAAAASEDKTLKMYDGLYHEIFNEPEQATVRADALRWINDRIASKD